MDERRYVALAAARVVTIIVYVTSAAFLKLRLIVMLLLFRSNTRRIADSNERAALDCSFSRKIKGNRFKLSGDTGATMTITCIDVFNGL